LRLEAHSKRDIPTRRASHFHWGRQAYRALHIGFELEHAEFGLGAVVGGRESPCRFKKKELVRKLTTEHSVGKCIPRVGRLERDDPCSTSRNWVFWHLRDVGRVRVGER